MKNVIETILNNDIIRKLAHNNFLEKIYSNKFVKIISNNTFIKTYYNKKIIWLGYIIFIMLIIIIYVLNIKPHKSKFREKIDSNYPSALRPSELAMLMYKKMIPEVITTTILMLIKNKKIIVKREAEDYIFMLSNANNYKLRVEQQCVIDMLFDLMGNGNKVKLSEIEKYASKKSNSSDFFTNYYVWKKVAQKETVHKNFFESKRGYKLIVIYKYIVILLVFINFITNSHWLSAYALILTSIALNLFFYKSFKRTKEANDEYHKWKGFKKYLLHHSNEISSLDNEQIYFYAIYGMILKTSNLNQNELFANFEDLNQKLKKAINKCVLNAELYAQRDIKWK